MYLHSYAINIEQKVRGLIGNRIDRYALGGMIDSDYIEYGGMVVAICAGLVKYYGNGNNEKIDKFLEILQQSPYYLYKTIAAIFPNPKGMRYFILCIKEFWVRTDSEKNKKEYIFLVRKYTPWG